MASLSILVILLAGVVCIGGLRLKAGQLRADQDPEAWWDEPSQQWVIRLTCGSFTFQGSPPLNVTWTTPAGEARFSSGYDSGRFYLNLDAPIQGGNYTCAIPSHHVPLLCEGDEEGPGRSNVSADVSVDELEARLTLVEANQKTLQKLVQDLQERQAQDIANVTQFCQGIKNTVDEQQEALLKIQEALNKSREPDVDLSGPCASGMYTVLDDLWRSTEEELEDYDDYHCDRDLDHGWYRFMLHGQNAVIPTSCVEDHRCETHAPQWVDLRGQSLPDVGQEVDARACANWNDNCCNWDSPITVRNCGAFFVYYLQPRDTCHLAYCAKPQH